MHLHDGLRAAGAPQEDALKQRVQFETAMELLREHGLLGNYRAKLAERMSTAAPHAARPPRRMTHSGSAAVSRLLEGFKFTEMPVAAGAASQPASRSAGIRRSVLAPIDQNGLPAGPTEARKKVRARRNDLSSTAGPQLAGDVDRTSNVDDSDVHDKLGTCMVEAAVTEASHLPMRSPHAGTNRLSRARTPATQEGSTAAVGSAGAQRSGTLAARCLTMVLGSRADDEGPMDSEARRVSERVIRRGVRPLYAELPLNAKLRQVRGEHACPTEPRS